MKIIDKKVMLLGASTLIFSLWAYGGLEQMWAALPENAAISSAVLLVFTVFDNLVPGRKVLS